MKNILSVIVIASCLTITYQDLKYRYIHLAGILVLALGLFFLEYNRLSTVLPTVISNCVFLTVLCFVLFLYFRIKNNDKKFINRYIGVGDLVLFAVFTIPFNTYNYIVFICSGCILAVLFWLFNLVIFNKHLVRIPLAGILTFYYSLVFITCQFVSFDTHTTTLIEI